MICFPNAKINLGLHVTEKRPDGFHNLETVFYPVSLADVLEIVKTDDERSSFSASGLPVQGTAGDNLCLKTYHLLQKELNLPPVKIYLYKVIPMGAGLGGGSSDAAFTLQLLNKVFNLNISKNVLREYASRLGSDCAFFTENMPVFATGRGDILENIQLDISGYTIVIVKPDIHINTAFAYSLIKPCKPLIPLQEIISLPVDKWKYLLINDFEAPVFEKYPAIANIKTALYNQGAVYVSMSGSGSAVYGLFKSKPNISGKFPRCFTWVS